MASHVASPYMAAAMTLDPNLAVVLLSGGLDSATCAAKARSDGRKVIALTIDYSQRHACELDAAARVAGAIGVVKHIVLPLDLRRFGGSALTDDAVDVPKDGVAADSIPVTYVPARNTVFLSLALALAEARGAKHIYIGVNALDYSGYPDCRPAFVDAFADLAALATRAGVEGDPFVIETPLLHLDKAGIAKLADEVGLDAGLTWTCYDPVGDRHCGTCDACRLRHKGFVEAGLPDPTGYAVAPPAP